MKYLFAATCGVALAIQFKAPGLILATLAAFGALDNIINEKHQDY